MKDEQNITMVANKRHGYTMVWQDVTQDNRLKNKELGLLVRLLSLPPNWQFCEKGLCTRFCIGKSELRSSLKKLENLSYLKRFQKRDEEGKFSKSIWIVSDHPTNDTVSDFPTTDNQLKGKPVTDNQTQYNTNELIRDKYNLSNRNSFYCTLKKTDNGFMDEHCQNCYLINMCPFQLMNWSMEKMNLLYGEDFEYGIISEMEAYFFSNPHYSFELRNENHLLTELEELFKILVDVDPNFLDKQYRRKYLAERVGM